MSTASSEQPERPRYLLIACLAMWLMGLNAAHEGFIAIQLVRDPISVGLGGPPEVRDALISAVAQHAKRALPVGIAEVMLGGLLVLVAANVLFARKPTLGFPLQVITANIAWVVISYALRQPIRELAIEAFVTSSNAQIVEATQTHGLDLLRQIAWWSVRLGVVMHALSLALCGFALTRPRVHEYLDYQRRAESEY